MVSLEKIEVESEGKPTASVIWLHGLGADGGDFHPIVPELQLPANIRFVFPHAPHRPVTINGGYVMRAWYDILESGLNARQDEAGVRDSGTLIETLIRRENEMGVPSSRIILAGFSQGGAMALFTGLRYPEKLAGLMILSAYLPLEAATLAETREENLAMPIFMAHGSQDPMVPMALAERGRVALEAKGAQIQWKDYPMPHSVCPQEIGDIGAWLRLTLGL